MPTSARRPRILLLDTSVAVALVVADHVAHEAATGAVRGWRLGLAGHAWFETFSVLTRLPPPARRSTSDVARMIERDFPESRFLSASKAAELARRLGPLGIAGGGVYDALIGAAAAQHELPLATRDRRALDTYRAFEVDVRLID